MKRLVPLVLIALTACSAATILVLRVDVLSFLSDAAAPIESSVPASSGLSIYLLPGIQVDALGAGPDVLMREGARIDLGFEAPGTGYSVAARIAVSALIRNLGGGEAVPPTSVEIRIASSDSADVYGEGALVGSGAAAAIAAGTATELDVVALLEEDDPGYQYVASGSFRLAISLTIGDIAGSAVPIELGIRAIDVELRARPFGVFE